MQAMCPSSLLNWAANAQQLAPRHLVWPGQRHPSGPGKDGEGGSKQQITATTVLHLGKESWVSRFDTRFSGQQSARLQLTEIINCNLKPQTNSSSQMLIRQFLPFPTSFLCRVGQAAGHNRDVCLTRVSRGPALVVAPGARPWRKRAKGATCTLAVRSHRKSRELIKRSFTWDDNWRKPPKI